MQLKNYQINAVNGLIEKSKKLLEIGNKSLILKSPTGSGKTIILAEFIQRLIKDDTSNNMFSFVWFAPQTLHIQSKEKLEKYFKDSKTIKCSFWTNLINKKKISLNEIFFCNWPSINRTKNNIREEREGEIFIDKFIENTKTEGRKIILIIDEVHHTLGTDNSNTVIDIISPNLTIEVSATPLRDADDRETVQLEHVKSEGMIKKQWTINPDSKNIITKSSFKTDLIKSSDAEIIKIALDKRKFLSDLYKKNGVNINPLLLIQLPSKPKNEEDRMKEDVMKILKENHNISIDNNNLEVLLSGEPRRKLKNLKKFDNEVEVLIFKQSIALGWDCPRAQIIVTLRHWNNVTFSIQVLGRIMRMPQPEVGHYDDEELNTSYVYTNNASHEIKENLLELMAPYNGKLIKEARKLKLSSFFKKRFRQTRVKKKIFKPIFFNIASKSKLLEKINTDPPPLKRQRLIEKSYSSAEAELDQSTESILDLSLDDMQATFDAFLRNLELNEFKDVQSYYPIAQTFYDFFKEKLNFNYENQNDYKKIINIICDNSNKIHFERLISEIMSEYKKQIEYKESELVNIKDFQFQKNYVYINDTVPFNPELKNCAVKGYRYKNLSNPEQKFISFLEKSPKVSWWIKNGDSGKNNFGINYIEHDKEEIFYVDFIVQLKTGKLGIFDTKKDLTLRIAGPKSDGLIKYIKKYKYFGGVVKNENDNYSDAAWKYYVGKGLEINNNENWKPLDL